MIWAIACGLAFVEKQTRWVMVAWAVALLALQLHVSAVILLVIALVLT